MSLVNENSFVVIGVIIAVIAVLATLRYGDGLWRWAIVVAVLAVIVTFQIVMRTGDNSVADLEGLEQALNAGRPVLVQFYSDL